MAQTSAGTEVAKGVDTMKNMFASVCDVLKGMVEGDVSVKDLQAQPLKEADTKKLLPCLGMEASLTGACEGKLFICFPEKEALAFAKAIAGAEAAKLAELEEEFLSLLKANFEAGIGKWANQVGCEATCTDMSVVEGELPVKEGELVNCKLKLGETEVGAVALVEETLWQGVSSGGVESPQFEPLTPTSSGGGGGNIDMLLDVSLPITVELGRMKMKIKDILHLGPGSVVQLEKLAGEPVEILVNDKLVALGEVVVIDEYFGVRVISIVSPEERIRRMG